MFPELPYKIQCAEIKNQIKYLVNQFLFNYHNDQEPANLSSFNSSLICLFYVPVSNTIVGVLYRCSAYVFPALNPFRLTFLRMRESDTTLVAMRDVYFSHPAAPTVKTVPIDVSAHARVNYVVNRRKFVVSEMFYSYLRHYMSSGVHHPTVAKHDNVQ